MNNSDWNKYEKLVLSELARISANLESVRDNQNKIKTDLEMLKTKMSIFSGAIAMVVSLAMSFVKDVFHK